MTHFADLDPCTLFGSAPGRKGRDGVTKLVAIGWLEAGYACSKGTAPAADVIARLAELLVAPWEPVHALGWHECSLCRVHQGPRSISVASTTGESIKVEMGITNVFIPDRDVIYVAPSLILHYIDSHEYAPPRVFCKAVRACPPMTSDAYLAAMKAAFIYP